MICVTSESITDKAFAHYVRSFGRRRLQDLFGPSLQSLRSLLQNNYNKASASQYINREGKLKSNQYEIVCLRPFDALSLVSQRAGAVRLFPLLNDVESHRDIAEQRSCFALHPSELKHMNEINIEVEHLGEILSLLKIDDSFTAYVRGSGDEMSERYYLTVQYSHGGSSSKNSLSAIFNVLNLLRQSNSRDLINIISAFEDDEGLRSDRGDTVMRNSARDGVHDASTSIASLARNIKSLHGLEFNKLRALCLDKFSARNLWDHSNKMSQFDLSEAQWSREENRNCLTLFGLIAADQDSIVSVGVRQNIRLMNDAVRGTIQSGTAHLEPFSTLGLMGDDEIIGTADTGLDENSCFFIESDKKPVERSSLTNPTFDLSKRKVIQYVNYSDSGDYTGGHGSHVAGTLAGRCIDESSDKSAYNGIAQNAKISMFDIAWPTSNPLHEYLNAPMDVSDMLKPSHAAGAKVFSGSWGGGFWYDSYCAGIDEYLFDHPDFLVVVAAGNMGLYGLNTVMSPGIAKNTITVGASVTPRYDSREASSLASFSSVGPTPDGRIKPDIIAPGQYVYSVNAVQESAPRESCAVSSKQGTSMATPVVAGAAALIRQYFRDTKFWASYCNPLYDLCKQGSFSPSGFLTKAIILHSGSPMMTFPSSLVSTSFEHRELFNFDKELRTPPDYQQGYGRVNLSSVLPIVRYDSSSNERFDLFVEEAELTSSQRMVYEVNVRSSSVPLKVTISWYDPPNVGFSPKLLVHDLDLIVISPDGSRRFGNCRPEIEVSACPRDLVNNNEQVYVHNPVEGLWKVVVESKLLTNLNKQRFGLVVTLNGTVESGGPEAYESIENACQSAFADSVGGTAKSLSFGMFNFGKNKVVDDEFLDSISISEFTSGVEVNKVSFDSPYFFTRKSICLPESCYRMTFQRTKGGVSIPIEATSTTDFPYADALTMSSFPACNAFVSPALTEQSFCVVKEEEDLRCVQSCELRDHIKVPIALADEYWEGDYYTIRDMKTNAIINAGTLEIGTSKYVDLCLPSKPACYELYVRTAENESPSPGNAPTDGGVDDPQIIFYTAKKYNDFRSAGSNTGSNCENYLKAGNQSAHICTDGKASIFIRFNGGNESITFDPLLFSKTDGLCAQSVGYKSMGASISNATYLKTREDVAAVIPDVKTFIQKSSSTIDIVTTTQALSDLLLDSRSFTCSYLRDAFKSADAFTNWTHFLTFAPQYARLRPEIQCSLAVYHIFTCSSIDHDVISPHVDDLNPGITTDLDACVEEIMLLQEPEPVISESHGAMTRSDRLLIALAIMSAGAVIALILQWRPCKWGSYRQASQLDVSKALANDSSGALSEVSSVSSPMASQQLKPHAKNKTGHVTITSIDIDEDDDDLEALGVSLGLSRREDGTGADDDGAELGSAYFEDRLRHLSSLIQEPQGSKASGPAYKSTAF